MNEVKDLLQQLEKGEIDTETVYKRIKEERYVDLGYANIDFDRKSRTGNAEIIYGEGKTAEQIVGILKGMLQYGQDKVLITRIDKQKASIVEKNMQELNASVQYYEDGRIAVVGGNHKQNGIGTIAVVTAGTSDIAVAEEAARTAEFLGNDVIRIYDVGVAGLHRLLNRMDDLEKATVIIAIAGMEGALASVVGGLVSAPVIAVPTSVGYGANFEGLSALLSMLNSCASGVSVVNIDNGFGAAYQASLINHLAKV